MEISNPRRILAVSLADSSHHLSDVIRDLTGTTPSPATPDATLAGTTHQLDLSTAYYRASVPVWLDLVGLGVCDGKDGKEEEGEEEEWATSFLSPEAREVLSALGAVVVVFPIASAPASAATGAQGQEQERRQRGLVRQVGRVVREGLGGWEWDGVGLGVAVGEVGEGEEVLDRWEDACAEWGLEFVHVPAAGGVGGEERRNEYGEKMGISRVLEALQANDWSQAEFDEEEEANDAGGGESSHVRAPKGGTDQGKGDDGAGDDDDDNDEFDPESLDFGFDREDFAGLRKAIWSAQRRDDDDDDDEFMDRTGMAPKGTAQDDRGEDGDEALGEDDVQKLEGMMQKLLAVRDMSAGLPEGQRKRMAKQAVTEVMKDL